MTNEKMVTVRWETCECEYRSKYCDEYHTAVARIPLSKIKEWIYANQLAMAGTRLREVVDTTPKPKIPEDAQHITWGTGDVAYSRYRDGRWYGWTDSGGLSDEELLTKIGNAEVTVLVRKDET